MSQLAKRHTPVVIDIILFIDIGQGLSRPFPQRAGQEVAQQPHHDSQPHAGKDLDREPMFVLGGQGVTAGRGMLTERCQFDFAEVDLSAFGLDADVSGQDFTVHGLVHLEKVVQALIEFCLCSKGKECCFHSQ